MVLTVARRKIKKGAIVAVNTIVTIVCLLLSLMVAIFCAYTFADENMVVSEFPDGIVEPHREAIFIPDASSLVIANSLTNKFVQRELLGGAGGLASPESEISLEKFMEMAKQRDFRTVLTKLGSDHNRVSFGYYGAEKGYPFLYFVDFSVSPEMPKIKNLFSRVAFNGKFQVDHENQQLILERILQASVFGMIMFVVVGVLGGAGTAALLLNGPKIWKFFVRRKKN